MADLPKLLLPAWLAVAFPAGAQERIAPYAPEAERAALRGAAAAVSAAGDRLAGTPLEKEKTAALVAALDEALRGAVAAAAAASSFEAAGREASDEVEALFDGADGEPGIEKRMDELSRERGVERARLAGLSGQSKLDEDKLKKLKEPPKNKDRLLELLHKEEEILKEASDALRASEAPEPALRESRDRMKEELRRCRTAFGELAGGAGAVRSRAEEIQGRAPEARASFGALGRPPEGEARSRAWGRIESLRDCARGLFLGADSALNRGDDLRSRREAFLRRLVRFEAAHKEARGKLERARESLDKAARLADEADDY